MNKIFSFVLGRRLFVTILDFALLLLAYSALKTTWFGTLHTSSDHEPYREAVHLWEGFGTVLLGFGVILEEYDSLAKIFRTQISSELNHKYHTYGVLFVLIGVIIEILAWLIKIPDSVVNTSGIEQLLLQFAAVLALISFFLLLRFIFTIWFGQKH